MKVVCDTNVLVSALLWKGALVSLYKLINEGKITVCFSGDTFKELVRVANYPHIVAKAKEESLDFTEAIKTLALTSEIVSPVSTPKIIKQDPLDDKFLACAVACQASFIISGGRHLLGLKEFEGIPIVSPKEFLRIIKK